MSTQAVQRRGVMILSIVALCVVSVGLLLLRSTPPAAAESTTVVADWPMDETTGTSMIDLSGNGITGVIGGDITIGVTHDDGAVTATGYRTPAIVGDPKNVTVNPERLVQVADDPNLDPSDRDLFVIEFQYRTTRSFGNVVQKGQNSGPGGYWKFELPGGEVTCLFQGPPIIDPIDGDPDNDYKRWPRKAVTTPKAGEPGDDGITYDDGNWHTVRCELDRDNPSYPDGIVRLYIDGVLLRVGPLTEPLGTIDNTAPLTIGGKANCNQGAVPPGEELRTCDYFDGDVGYVRVERSGSVPPPTTTPPTTTTTSPTTTTTTPPTTTTTTPPTTTPPVPPGQGIGAATAGAPAERVGTVSLP